MNVDSTYNTLLDTLTIPPIGKTLSKRTCTSCEQKCAGTVSNGNETVLVQKHTSCDQGTIINSNKTVNAETHSLCPETCRAPSATGLSNSQCRYAQHASRNTQGMISNGTETLWMQKCMRSEQKWVVIISDGNETLLMQKHTLCGQKRMLEIQQSQPNSVPASDI